MNSIPIKIVFLACLTSLLGCGEVITLTADSGVIDGQSAQDASPVDPCAEESLTFDSYVECYLPKICENELRCRPVFKDVDQCITAFTQQILSGPYFALIAQGIDNGTIEIDQSMFRACLDEFSTLTCNDNSTAACDQILVGTIPDRRPCVSDEQCVGSRGFCDRPSGDDELCRLGSCVASVGRGELCQNDSPRDARCNVGTYCVDNGTEQRCENGELGSACDGSYQCEPELYCSASICSPLLASGADCTSSEQCQGNELCIGAGNPMPRCQLADSIGASCDGGCTQGLSCKDNLCVEPPREVGDVCDQDCGSLDLQCMNEQCIARAGLDDNCRSDGALCTIGLICEEEICSNTSSGCTGPTVCIEPAGIGELCASHTHCASGYCDVDRCSVPLTCSVPPA